MSAARTRLLPLLEPVVEGAGAELEDLSITAAGRRSVVRVVVDRDGGVSLDDVADISRVVSEALDALDQQDPSLLGGSYVLEVSSPGVDRPLTAPRHWRRARGRLVRAVLRDGDAVTGRVLAVDDDRVLLDSDGVQRGFALTDLERGTVQVEFTRASGPDGQEPA